MIPGFLLFTVSIFAALKLSTFQMRSQNYQNVCHFVDQKIYLSSVLVKVWKADCLKESKKLSAETPLEVVIQTFNRSFAMLNASHLSLYPPTEVQKIWKGEVKATGIESHYVGGELVISKVHPESPASRAGLKFGDVILKINGELGNPDQAETASGKYLILASSPAGGVHQRTVDLNLASFQKDEEVRLTRISEDTVVLRVPSFRAEYFERKEWLDKIQTLKKYSHLILDLRGNLGGNFVAGLRLLSPFLCKPTTVGSLLRPKWPAGTIARLPDQLEDAVQIKLVDENQRVELSTFKGYDCLSRETSKPLGTGKASVQIRITVLVDSSTMSTSEMVAQALKEFKQARIVGSASAGKLLVGMWYAMPEIGEGVRMSIPEALYESHTGRALEGTGVEVDEVLYYHLHELQRGEDSWIRSVSKQNAPK